MEAETCPAQSDGASASSRSTLEQSSEVHPPPEAENVMQHENSVLSFDSSDENKDDFCVPGKYTVSRSIVRRGLQRLDSIHAPGSPGELRSSVVMSTLRRFDITFENRRTESERQAIVNQLERSLSDYTRVRWNSESLLLAFSVWLTPRERIYFTVDLSDSTTTLSRIVSTSMVFTILLSIVLWMAGTMSSMNEVACDSCLPQPRAWMKVMDDICVVIFTSEYLARLLTVSGVRSELLSKQFIIDLLASNTNDANHVPVGRGFKRLIRFLRTPTSICDLLTVLPYWIEVIFEESAANLPWLRLFRLLRVSRVFKLFRLLNSDLGQLSDANHLLTTVFMQAFPAFAMVLVLVLFALVVFSSLMYIVEKGDWYSRTLMQADPCQNGIIYDTGKFLRTRRNGRLEISPFPSMPAAYWWTLATVTTVGYGDVVPVTTLGKVIGCSCVIYGTVLLGLPIGILGAQFSTEFGRMVLVSRRRAEIMRERMGAAKNRKEARARSSMALGEGGNGKSLLAQISNGDVEGNTKKVGLRRQLSKKMGQKMAWGRSGLSRLSTVSMTFVPKHKERALTMVEAAVENFRKLNLDAEDREKLRHAKNQFEDMVRLHGDVFGIPPEQAQLWAEELQAMQFCAGPPLDRLCLRVLTILSEAELVRPGNAIAAQMIRQSWHELCLVCCRITENLEKHYNGQKNESAEEQEMSEADSNKDEDDQIRSLSNTHAGHHSKELIDKQEAANPARTITSL